jgi:hypothetical protein
MKALRIILIILLALILVPSLLRLIGITIALVKDFGSGATHVSSLLGSFVGTLVVCVLFGWLIKYLWTKNKSAAPAPPAR